MAVAIRIPAPDPTTEKVRVVRWMKERGETVKKQEPLLEIETDKAVVEVESFEDGVLLQTFVQPDDTVPVGTMVAVVGAEGEDYAECLK